MGGSGGRGSIIRPRRYPLFSPAAADMTVTVTTTSVMAMTLMTTIMDGNDDDDDDGLSRPTMGTDAHAGPKSPALSPPHRTHGRPEKTLAISCPLPLPRGDATLCLIYPHAMSLEAVFTSPPADCP